MGREPLRRGKQTGGSGSGTFRGHITPVEAPDGSRVQFTLPDGELFQGGSLQVFLNGVKYQPTSILEGLTRNNFMISTDLVPQVGDSLAISYMLG